MVLANPTRDRRAERHEASRAEIIEVAWELARAEGLAAVSLREIARRVGMQAPSLYSYFDSKNAIYDAMFAQGAREFLDSTRPVETGDALRDLQADTRFFVQFCSEDAARYQLLFQRTIPGFEPSAESFAIAVAGLQVARERLSRMGFDDPEVLDLLTAIRTGLADQQISNDPGGDRWIRLADEAMEMFFRHVTTRISKKKGRSRS